MSIGPDRREIDPSQTSALARPEAPERARRARALLSATLTTLDNSSSTPCLVNNISSSGARLVISESVPIGAEFKVSIPQRHILRSARQIWRRGDQLGVSFILEVGSTPLAEVNDKDAKIRALEAEVAGLKAEIGVLRNRLFQHEDT